jgi:NADPH2:quinone reductase
VNNAIRIHGTGGPEVLKLEEVPAAAPVDGEVLVRHRAIGINYIDTYHRSGLYPLPSLPHGIGVEAAGVVEAVGGKVSDFRVGDRVAYVAAVPGSYADLRSVPADRLVALPAGISDETAAAMMLKGMTVEYLIRRTFPVKSGMKVLLHAAAGGVGLLACQWLAHLGAEVIGTVGSKEKADLAVEHGCKHPIVYTQEDFVARVRELTNGKGVPVVYDAVGKSTFLPSLDCLSPRGTYVSFGNASGKPDPFDMAILSQKGSLFLTRPTLYHYAASRADLTESANALFEVVQSGAVRVEIRQRWALGEAAEAHRALEGRRTVGSSLLIPTGR